MTCDTQVKLGGASRGGNPHLHTGRQTGGSPETCLELGSYECSAHMFTQLLQNMVDERFVFNLNTAVINQYQNVS